MREVELDNEIKAIKTMCGKLEKPRTILIELGLSEEHFHDSRTKETWRCIQALSRELKAIPTFFALSTYPQLSPEARELISAITRYTRRRRT